MNIRLSPGLQGHRWGRLLQNVLSLPAGQAPALPTETEPALVMMLGEEFAESPALQDAWLRWAKQPSHVLLLVPPYRQGVLTEELDWQFALMPEAPKAQDSADGADALLSKLAPEVSSVLNGQDGASDRKAGHCWRDGAINTRYWKVHANSGIFAATCLPLGSISLLGEGSALLIWLQVLHQHVGRAAPQLPNPSCGVVEAPSAQQIAVMLCCYAYGLATAEALLRVFSLQAIPVMRLDGYDLPALFVQLRSNGWLQDTGLSAGGLALLRDGPYWRYAKDLREMAQS